MYNADTLRKQYYIKLSSVHDMFTPNNVFFPVLPWNLSLYCNIADDWVFAVFMLCKGHTDTDTRVEMSLLMSLLN